MLVLANCLMVASRRYILLATLTIMLPSLFSTWTLMWIWTSLLPTIILVLFWCQQAQWLLRSLRPTPLQRQLQQVILALQALVRGKRQPALLISLNILLPLIQYSTHRPRLSAPLYILLTRRNIMWFLNVKPAALLLTHVSRLRSTTTQLAPSGTASGIHIPSLPIVSTYLQAIPQVLKLHIIAA